MSNSNTHQPSQASAFDWKRGGPVSPALQKMERDAAKSRRSTATVVRNLARGNNLSAAGTFSPRSASTRYSAPVIGREAGEKQRDTSDSIRRGGI